MRSVISAAFCNPDDFRSFGIHPVFNQDEFEEPDLSDTVDTVELAAINRSLAAHTEEIDQVIVRPSYRFMDYYPERTPPTTPAKAMWRRAA